jgi:hypothetical protein
MIIVGFVDELEKIGWIGPFTDARAIKKMRKNPTFEGSAGQKHLESAPSGTVMTIHARNKKTGENFYPAYKKNYFGKWRQHTEGIDKQLESMRGFDIVERMQRARKAAMQKAAAVMSTNYKPTEPNAGFSTVGGVNSMGHGMAQNKSITWKQPVNPTPPTSLNMPTVGSMASGLKTK